MPEPTLFWEYRVQTVGGAAGGQRDGQDDGERKRVFHPTRSFRVAGRGDHWP